MSNKIDFTNPFNGRNYLLMLKPHNKFGLVFSPNLDVKKKLGFSFRSNEYGFRGPANIAADNVICGTSYAMGLSVNNGENWYELTDHTNFFNIGMPVGVKNHINVIDELYVGNKNNLVYIYHPNIWVISKNFDNAHTQNFDIFKFMRWETNYLKTLKLYIKWKLRRKYLSHNNLEIKYKDKIFSLNTQYSYIDTYKDKESIESTLNNLNKLFGKFKNIYVFRIPIKEQIGINYTSNLDLRRLNDNYNQMWEIFCDAISPNVIVCDLNNEFDLDDYLENDTHWNKNGNKKFNHLYNRFISEKQS